MDDVTGAGPAGGGVIITPNPYVWSSGYDLNNRQVTVSFAWNPTTRALSGITVHRDPECQFVTILVGLGDDGRPNSTDKSIDLSTLNGDRVLPANRLAALAARGLATIDDVLALQITAA